MRVNDAYAKEHGLWRMEDFRRLKGRLGTVITAMPPLIEVLFDRRHIQGREILVAFYNPDSLQLVKRPRWERG